MEQVHFDLFPDPRQDSDFIPRYFEQTRSFISCHHCYGRMRSGDPGRSCSLHSRRSSQQPSSLCQWYRLGAALFLSYLHCRLDFHHLFYVVVCRFRRANSIPVLNGQLCSNPTIYCLLTKCRRRPSSFDMGHSANAARHRRSDSRVHGSGRGDQPDPVGSHSAGLDRHLLQPFLGNPASVETSPYMFYMHLFSLVLITICSVDRFFFFSMKQSFYCTDINWSYCRKTAHYDIVRHRLILSVS